MTARDCFFRRVLIAASAAIMLAGTGCAAMNPAVTPAHQAIDSEVAALADRDRRLKSLAASAIMEYTGPSGHLKVRERILVRRPSSLRVEALSPLGVAMVVAADDQQLAIYDPSKNTLTRGPASADTLSRVAQIPLMPAEAVRLLLALPPASTLAGSQRLTAADGQSIEFRRTDGGVDEIAFADGNLARVRAMTPDGVLIYQVDYSDYRDIGALEFPHVIDASFAASATTVRLHYQDPVVDGVFPDSEFVLSPGPRTKELRLGNQSMADDPRA